MIKAFLNWVAESFQLSFEMLSRLPEDAVTELLGQR
jgi:hypothetical protein